MVPSLNGNCATHFFKWLHVYQYIEHTVEYNCHFRAGGETGECFQLWFMFAVRYVNTAVIDGIVNGTMRSGEKFLPFHPRTLKDLTRHFSFLKLCFPDLIQLLKLVCFFFCFLKINDVFFFSLSATSTFLLCFAQALRVSIPEEALGSLRVSDKLVLEESQEHKSISS